MSQPGHGVELADDAHHTPRPRSTTGSLRRELVAIGLVAALVALIGLTPLLTNSHFYWYDDSAGGAYGQWFELGRQISHGHWPLLNPSAWMAGNYTVEQFGLLNPVVIVIGLITQLVSNAAVMATGVKLFFMMVGGAGVYALARQFGARRCLSVMAGVAAPLGGFTLFLDATSWVTNLEVWAYFPWVLWGLWRFIVQKKSYWPAFAAGYLTITVAYVQGTVMVVFAFVAFLIWCAIRRTASRALRTVLAGLPMGLLTWPCTCRRRLCQRRTRPSDDLCGVGVERGAGAHLPVGGPARRHGGAGAPARPRADGCATRSARRPAHRGSGRPVGGGHARAGADRPGDLRALHERGCSG
ncbi:hypothetical protein, partial [Propionibacterium freudenreichii]